MTDFLAGSVFQVDHETFSWRDVVLFTHRTGRWADVLGVIEEGLAAIRRLAQEEDEALEERVEAAAAEFRYERELITAEETESWLRERGVTASEWLASVRRGVLREHFAEGLAEGRGTATREEIERAVRVDLCCTELGRRLAESCAGHAAAAAAVGRLTPGAESSLSGPLPPCVDAAHARARLPLLDQMLQGVEQFRQAGITDEAIRREIQNHRMEWVRLECRTLAFPDLPQAREAALCLREDGLGIDEVADNAHLRAEEVRFYVDDLDPGLQASFVSAKPGDVIGPSAMNASHTLFQVLSKTMPGEQDPEVRDRAAERLFARALVNESQRRVHWRTAF